MCHQKGKPFWVFMKQDMIQWQWQQLDWSPAASRSREITTTTPHLSSFYSQMLIIITNQQSQSTEGNSSCDSNDGLSCSKKSREQTQKSNSHLAELQC